MNIEKELMKVAKLLEAEKNRPSTLFEGLFFDVRNKMKDIKKQLSEETMKLAEIKLRAELKNRGIEIIELDMKLGRFRGSFFITSCRLLVSGNIDGLEKWLQENMSPKFRFKEKNEQGILFNIR